MINQIRSCPACRSQVSRRASRCPHCGRPMFRSVWPVVLLIVAVVGILWLVFAGVGQAAKERAIQEQREANSLQDYDRAMKRATGN